jgi:ferritin-like metal-binding protein YciE
MTTKNTLIAWLNDAHAMETELQPILRNHARDAKKNADVSQRIDRHAQETAQQAERVRQALAILGTTPSVLKSGSAAVAGLVMSVSTGMFSDELVKNALMDYATEHFEIAAYNALITAAEALGETEVARLCRENLREEEEMAKFLAAQLPATVKETLLTTA